MSQVILALIKANAPRKLIRNRAGILLSRARPGRLEERRELLQQIKFLVISDQFRKAPLKTIVRLEVFGEFTAYARKGRSSTWMYSTQDVSSAALAWSSQASLRLRLAF